MDFSMVNPDGPNLVSAIMEDRLREAAKHRAHAGLSIPQQERSTWARRFFSGLANRPVATPRTATPVPRN